MIGKDINRLMESNQRRLAEKDQEIESLKSMIRSIHRKLLTIRHTTIDENIKKYTFFRKYEDKKVLSKKGKKSPN